MVNESSVNQRKGVAMPEQMWTNWQTERTAMVDPNEKGSQAGIMEVAWREFQGQVAEHRLQEALERVAPRDHRRSHLN